MKRATSTALKRARMTWPEASWCVVDDDFDIRLRARIGDLFFEAWQDDGDWRASLVLMFDGPLLHGAEMVVRRTPHVAAMTLVSAIRTARDETAVVHARALLESLDAGMVSLVGAESAERARIALAAVVEAGGVPGSVARAEGGGAP